MTRQDVVRQAILPLANGWGLGLIEDREFRAMVNLLLGEPKIVSEVVGIAERFAPEEYKSEA